MDQYNCTGKKDGSKCYCKFKIMSCTPQGGARCKEGRCKQGINKGDRPGFPWGLSNNTKGDIETPPPPPNAELTEDNDDGRKTLKDY